MMSSACWTKLVFRRLVPLIAMGGISYVAEPWILGFKFLWWLVFRRLVPLIAMGGIPYVVEHWICENKKKKTTTQNHSHVHLALHDSLFLPLSKDRCQRCRLQSTIVGTTKRRAFSLPLPTVQPSLHPAYWPFAVQYVSWPFCASGEGLPCRGDFSILSNFINCRPLWTHLASLSTTVKFFVCLFCFLNSCSTIAVNLSLVGMA